MTLEAIKEAITHLSDAEKQDLTEWFDTWIEDDWDREMARDFSPGGRGEHSVEKVDREIAEGKFASFEEGLKQWREQHAER